ncbi:MAG TPA: ThuA domain-containing protein [Armatimonadota bacterium]
MSKLLLLGGLTTAYHYFGELAPVITRTIAPAGFEVICSEDLSVLSEANLKNYAGVVNYTTNRDLSDEQWAALKGFILGGGGYIGIHNATDTFKNQPEAIKMIGGIFVTHPAQLDVPVEIAALHPVTEGVEPFTVHDELYIMEHHPDTYTLLARTPAEGSQPIAWVREEGGGRVFYLALGHNTQVYENPNYAKLLQRGVQWATRSAVTA